MMRSLRLLLLVCLMSSVLPLPAQNRSIVACQYWFDQGDEGVVEQPVSATDTVRLQVHAGGLATGLHQLYLRVKDNEDKWSHAQSWMFIVRQWPKHSVQQVASGEYWIDDHYGERVALAMNDSVMTFAVDGTTVAEGLHTLHVRLQDDEGRHSTVNSWLFMRAYATDSTRAVTAGEYWIDNGKRTTVSATDGQLTFVADASSFGESLHTLNYRAKDSHGKWSQMNTHLFVRTVLRDTTLVNAVESMAYWFDDDLAHATTMAVQSDSLTFAADASQLCDGLHTLTVSLTDKLGHHSTTNSWLFMRAYATDSTRTVTAGEYWIDNGKRTTVSATDGQLAFVADASSFGEGLHTLNYRAKDSHGKYTAMGTHLFMRNALRDTTFVNAVRSVSYWLDGDTTAMTSVAATGDTITFTANASTLRDGLHTLSYRATDAAGRHSGIETWAFFKRTERMATRIKWYEYWWNNHTDKAVRETVESDSTEFVFERQLTVPEYAKTDGYSRNSVARFHIVFGDDGGRISSTEWADVSYPDEQAPVSTIEIAEQTEESISLKWSANEDNIACYNIYYSAGNQPFVLWLPNTTGTTATFKGQPGKTYRFTVTAQDQAGNREQYDENKVSIITAK